MKRREFLAGLAAASLAPLSASAQAYPARPVRLVVGYAAGGANDIIARLVGAWLAERLGQPFVIENRPGAASNIATDAVTHAPPDGYTLLLAGASNAINATLYTKLNFDFIRDIAPVGGITRLSNVMLIHPSLPPTTVSEFIEYAKKTPNRLVMGSPGNGSPQHVAGELFRMMTGVEMVHVPYRGGAPALIDLLGGQIPVCFASTASSVAYVKAGTLRALGVTTAHRSDAMPDVPAIAETVPGYEASAFYGIAAPRKTPADIVDHLNREINAGLADPKMAARLADVGGVVLPGSPESFGQLIADETQKWGRVVKFSGAKVT